MKDKRKNMRKLLSAHFCYIVGTEFNNAVVDELFKLSRPNTRSVVYTIPKQMVIDLDIDLDMYNDLDIDLFHFT